MKGKGNQGGIDQLREDRSDDRGLTGRVRERKAEAVASFSGILGVLIASFGLVLSALSLQPLYAVLALPLATISIVTLVKVHEKLENTYLRRSPPQVPESLGADVSNLSRYIGPNTSVLEETAQGFQTPVTETSAQNTIVSAPIQRASSAVGAQAEEARA